MRKPVCRSLVAALALFQLGAIVLACPMPVQQAVTGQSLLAAKCAETHGHSRSNGHATDATDATALCKARIGVNVATLIRDRSNESAELLLDSVPAIDLTIRVGFEPPSNVHSTQLPLLVHSSPLNLKYRVIRI